MLNPLVNNSDTAPAPATLIPDLQADMPQVEEEDEAKPSRMPEPPKEWIEHVYTFQDLQTQANLCTWTGEMQKQGI